MSPPTASDKAYGLPPAVRDQTDRPENETKPSVRPLAAMDWENGKLAIARDYGCGYKGEEEIPAKQLIKRPVRYLLPGSDVVVEGIHLNTPRDRSNAQIYWLEELEELGCNLDKSDIRIWLFPHRLSYRYEDLALPAERSQRKHNGEAKIMRNKKYDYRFLLRYCEKYGLPTKRWKPPNEETLELRQERNRLRAEISDMANLLRTSGARGIHPAAVEVYKDFLYRTAVIGPRMSEKACDFFAMKARPISLLRKQKGDAGWMYSTRRESVLKIAYACVFDKNTTPRHEGNFSTRYIAAMAGLSDQGCASHMRSTILGGDAKKQETNPVVQKMRPSGPSGL
jgi:hypothetical protein